MQYLVIVFSNDVNQYVYTYTLTNMYKQQTHLYLYHNQAIYKKYHTALLKIPTLTKYLEQQLF